MDTQSVNKAISMHLWNMSHGGTDGELQGPSPASPDPGVPSHHMDHNPGPHDTSMLYQHRYESPSQRHLVPRPAHTGVFPPSMNPPGPPHSQSHLSAGSGGSVLSGMPGHPGQPQLSSGSSGSPLVVPQPIGKSPGRSIKTYHCRMCDQIFDSKSDLLVHSQHVHKQDPKPYKCPTCNKCFANSSYLSQHARIHSGIKPYKCQICERRFTQLCHLQQHIRTHTGEKPYKCQHPGCGKAFSQLSNLQSHSRSHMTDKPYRCNSCYKCFVDEQSLREHIPKHSETKHLKTHICRLCGKSYTQETYLARHMTKHNVDSERSPITSKPMGISSLGPQQGEPPDIKPQLDGNGSISNENKGVSAFMPLPHQFQGPNPLMNSSVPSTFPFSTPRLPNNSLNSPLSHMSTGSSPRYFPFEPLGSFPKRDPIDSRSQLQSMSREGMIANSLLSLQQIKQFHSSHPVFPKSEPGSPMHKEFP